MGSFMEGLSNAFPRAASASARLPLWSVVVLYLLAAVAWMGVAFGSIALQAAIQGLVVGSIYVLGAAGLSLTYGIRRFANFAHGDYMTVGAYAAFFVAHPTEGLGQHVFLGVVAAVLTVAAIAMLLEIGVFRRLEGRPTAALIASVGIALVIQNVISAIFLPDVRTFPVAVPPDFAIGDTGLTFNAVEGGVTLGVFGFFVLLFIFAAVIIGGIGSPYGAMLGGLIVGFVQKLSNVLGGELQQAGILEGGSAYEPAGAFIIMIVVLLLKPEGIMGTPRPGPARRALRLPTWGRGGARRGV